MNCELIGQWALHVGGALHFVQVPAMLGLALVVRQRNLAADVAEPVRRILAVLGGGIVLLVLPGGVASALLPIALLRSPFGYAYVATWCVFWTYRWLAQLIVYAPLIPPGGVLAHRCLVLVFSAKVTCYALAWLCLLGT
jgi:hypothetical protein